MKKVLLVCGTGASSGFMAANVRKAVSARGLEMEFIARSDTEIDEYLDSIDMLLIGPHLSYMFDEIKEEADEEKVPVYIIPQEIYGSLNGEQLLDFSLEKLGG